MRGLDLLHFDFQVLYRSRFRAAMLLIAMSIGVAAVNVLTGLGEGARSFVLGEFSMLGNNTLIMMPGKKETSGGMPPIMGTAPRDITLQDAAALRRLPGVGKVAPLIVGMAEISHGRLNREVVVVGTNQDFFSIRQLALQQGEALPVIQDDIAAPVAVLGVKLKKELFGESLALGQWLKAGDRRFRVIGITEAKGQSLGMDMNDIMIVPIASAQALFNQAGLFRVMIEARRLDNLAQIKQRVLETMIQRHDQEEDVTLITQDSVMSAFNDILDTMSFAVAGIGAISMVVAGILIMNVTLISVAQRTQEIGLLKAVGASNRDVLTIFLTEALLIACIGALLGLAIGQALLWLGRWWFPEIGFYTPWWALITSLLVALFCALIFAWRPARRAAKMEPVDALQSH